MGNAMSAARKLAGKSTIEMFDDVPVLQRKWQAALVPGQPLWLSAPSAPGGKMLNGSAFLVPSTIRQGTEGRNIIPGLGLTQVDLSFERKFALTERVNLQFRTDAFNLLNHPNFGPPVSDITSPDFGRILNTVPESERQLQFGLRLAF